MINGIRKLNVLKGIKKRNGRTSLAHYEIEMAAK